MSKTKGPRRNRRRRTTDELELGTDKLYFKIGEVAEIVDVAASVLRYWESEFPMLKPQKSRSRHRVYGRKDVETALKIKQLLYQRKFTIAGARQELERGRSRVEAAAPAAGYRARQSMGEVRERLGSLRATLRDWESPPAAAADPAEFLRLRGGVRALLDEREVRRGLGYRPDRELGRGAHAEAGE